jgi:hypothetical protein
MLETYLRSVEHKDFIAPELATGGMLSSFREAERMSR